MALVKCGTCKQQVASNARVCPKCGARRTSWVTKLVAGLIGFVVLSSVITFNRTDAPKNDGIPVAAPDVDLSKLKTAPQLVAAPRTLTPPNNFRGHAWGSKPTKDMKVFGVPSNELWSRKSASEPFMGVPVASESTMYDNGRLYRGQLYIDGAGNFETLRSALTTEYGRPTFENHVLHIYSWSWPGSLIKIKIYRTQDTATFDISNQAI